MEPIIFHVDVNSAFLSWTAAYQVLLEGSKRDLRELPSVIGGSEENRHGIVLAKSIPAKKYQIVTGEPLASARSKCPGLVVEPPDYALYVNNSKALMQLLGEYSPETRQYSIDESFVDMTGTEGLWGEPLVAAWRMRSRIKEELGFTVNIGISSNQLLAKMASDFRKPDRCHTLFPDEIPKKMWPLPVADLFFVGRKTEEKLYGLGIRTIGELAAMDVEILKAHFKRHGEVIHQYANGVDTAPYLTIPEANQGYGNSVTVAADIRDVETAHMVILSLCETVAARLRADDVKVITVMVSMVDRDFCHVSKQGQMLSYSEVTDDIYQKACRLFDEIWDGRPVRQMGVQTSKVVKEDFYQMNFLDGADYERKRRLLQSVDEVRERYGEDSMMRARFIDQPISHMSGGLDREKRQGITKPIYIEAPAIEAPAGVKNRF